MGHLFLLPLLVQEEAKEAVESLLNNDLHCVKEYKEGEEGGGRTILVDSVFNIFVINVLWQIVASKRFDPASEASRNMMQVRVWSKLENLGIKIDWKLIQNSFFFEKN